MASVSVVHFNSSPPHKVLQQANGNNNNSERREVIILRKNAHILPQPRDYCKEDILITNPGRKKPRSGGTSVAVASGGGQSVNNPREIRTAPQPIAVARRNARERNRVKQVNNGFANLRQHIPNFIAAAFESNSRGGSKKLSKVETLRMAVEYIRSLEEVLAMDETGTNISNSSISSFSSPSSTSTTTTGPGALPYQILSPSLDEDDLSSSNATPPPSSISHHHHHQYIRIDTTTNTYQIIQGQIYDDSENLEPIDEQILADPTLIDTDLEFSNNLLSTMHTSDSLSPGMYSEQSLSPRQETIGFIPIQIKTEDDIPVISLKTEQELPDQDVKTNVLDVIQWWEEQQSPHP